MPRKSKAQLDHEIKYAMRTPGSMLSDVASNIAHRREVSSRDLGPSIGSTGNGKLVYEHAVSSAYDGFTKQDHLDAANLHRDFAGEHRMNHKFKAHHKLADEHERRAALL